MFRLDVLAVIYEARPNVTVDAAGLALKSGNAVILRGSSETLNSNRALVQAIHNGLTSVGLPEGAVQFVDSPSRELVFELLKLHDDIDMVIPRGGSALHTYCRENSMIPVITGGIGICHLYVDASANLEKALPVIRNAKIQRPSVCNSLDTLLVHSSVAKAFIPTVVETLAKDGVSFRVDEAVGGMPAQSFAQHLFNWQRTVISTWNGYHWFWGSKLSIHWMKPLNTLPYIQLPIPMAF